MSDDPEMDWAMAPLRLTSADIQAEIRRENEARRHHRGAVTYDMIDRRASPEARSRFRDMLARLRTPGLHVSPPDAQQKGGD